MYIIKIKNDTDSSQTWAGKEFAASEEYIVPTDSNRAKWQNDSLLLTAIGNSEALVGDGSGYFDDVSEAINWLRGDIPKDVSIIDDRIEVRTTNCVSGRKLHDRFITIETSNQDEYDNTDWQENDYGDVTYIMKDADGDTTTTNANAKETWIDFEPDYDYEAAGGAVFIPTSLSGGNDNAWEVHVVAAPDLPASYGGNVHLIANPRIKWGLGSWISACSVNNPAEMTYNATYHSNKIRFVFKHPVGAQTEFQLRLQLYK